MASRISKDTAQLQELQTLLITHEEDGSARLTPTQERVLGYIARETKVNGSAKATKKEMADMLHRNQRTIDRAIARLKDEGLIVVVPQHLDDGRQVGNAYRIA